MTFFFSGFHADYLKANDEMDKIDLDILCIRTQLIYDTAWELAIGTTKHVLDQKVE